MGRKSKNGNAAGDSFQPGTPGVCILPAFLFLGPAACASNRTFLETNGISQVLSIGHSASNPLELSIEDPDTGKKTPLTYTRLRLNDDESSSPKQCIDEACTLLTEWRKKGSIRVLIHCSAAISRSPTVVVGYLIRHESKTLQEALGMVIRAKPSVCPNPGFLAWLEDEEREIHDGVSTFSLERLPAKREDRLALFQD